MLGFIDGPILVVILAAGLLSLGVIAGIIWGIVFIATKAAQNAPK